MDTPEQAAQEILAQLDQFCAGVRQILAGGTPVGGKMQEIVQLREKVLRELKGRIDTFAQWAQDREREVLEQLARLRQSRDQVTVIQHGVLPMFTFQPGRDGQGHPALSPEGVAGS